MKTLLKDLPEFKERIENNYLLGEQIKDSLNDIELDETSLGEAFKTDFIDSCVKSLRDAEFKLEGNEIKIANKMDLALQIFDNIIENLRSENMTILNSGSIAQNVREKLTEFVNENYTFKGI